MSKNKQKILNISLIIVGILLVALIGSIFVNLGLNWYAQLNVPSQWILGIIIPIMWTIIYIVFATILIDWVVKTSIPKDVVTLLIINGILNLLWCLLFFTLHLTFVGSITIILNLVVAIVLIVRIFKYNEVYAFVASIYPIWVAIATTLNLCIWILN